MLTVYRASSTHGSMTTDATSDLTEEASSHPNLVKHYSDDKF